MKMDASRPARRSAPLRRLMSWSIFTLTVLGVGWLAATDSRERVCQVLDVWFMLHSPAEIVPYCDRDVDQVSEAGVKCLLGLSDRDPRIGIDLMDDADPQRYHLLVNLYVPLAYQLAIGKQDSLAAKFIYLCQMYSSRSLTRQLEPYIQGLNAHRFFMAKTIDLAPKSGRVRNYVDYWSKWQAQSDSESPGSAMDQLCKDIRRLKPADFTFNPREDSSRFDADGYDQIGRDSHGHTRRWHERRSDLERCPQQSPTVSPSTVSVHDLRPGMNPL